MSNVLDGGPRLPVYSPTCTACRHLKSAMTPMCDAFPTENGIPEEIWRGKNDHCHPYLGDHGVQFEPRSAQVEAA